VAVARSAERIWHTAYALYVLAHVQTLAGEWDEASALVEEGRAIAESYRDLQGLAYARDVGGELALLRGDPQTVVDAYERAKAVRIDEWERWLAATAYLELGDSASAGGIVADMLRDGGLGQSQALRIRGMITARHGAWDEAERDLLQALNVARGQKFRQEEGLALHELGLTLAARGDRDQARERLGEALRLFREMGAHAYADRTERALSEMLAS
jgi:tetratricopeptide (TPR) repeat protein